MRRTRWVALAGLLAMVPVALSACGSQSESAAAHMSHPLAVVNGQPLSDANWMLAVRATDLLQQVTLSTNRTAKNREVKELVGEIADEQYALKHHWVTVSKAHQEASEFLDENVLTAFGSKAKMGVALRKKRLTVARLREFLVAQMELNAAFAHAAAGVKPPSLQQLRAYYRAHPSLFTKPRQDKMRMILVKHKKLAELLMNELEQGASWKVLAAKYSLDPASKNVGGEYGWVDTGPASGFVTPFYQEMDKLKPGQYGIAHSQYGYHVIEVQATRPPQLAAFSAVESALSSNLLQQKQGAAFMAFTKRVEKLSHIIIAH